MKEQADLLLVSGSPRRRELLDLLGLRYRVLDADIDESRLPQETPGEMVKRLAVAKARAGMPEAQGTLPALGADTIVLLDDEILGKPRSRDAAMRMLTRLSGRVHEVLTAVAVVTPGGRVFETLNTTRVQFADMPGAWIKSYASTDEPMDKAGAYAIQGQAAQWICGIEGSFSGVMGLPLYETAEVLRAAGVRRLDQPGAGAA